MIDYLNCWQLHTCVCLEKIPGEKSRGANDCWSSCSGNNAAETNTRFQNDCGGHKTYNIFKSGTFFVWQNTDFKFQILNHDFPKTK